MLLIALLVALFTASARALSIHAPTREQHKIPRTVHQFLQEGALTPAAAHRQKTWKAAHPHWEYKLWTHDENNMLVAEHYAWFKETYEGLPAPAVQDEVARFLYLHHHGGMFADWSSWWALRAVDDLVKGQELCPAGMFADTQLVALRAMDDLVDAHKLVLASSAADDAPTAYTNEWMASARWHPFWLFALADVIRANESSVAGMTGSAVLDKAVAAYKAADARGLDTLSAGVLYTSAHRGTLQGHMDGNPRAMSMCDAEHADFDAAECRGRFFPSAYTIPAWSSVDS